MTWRPPILSRASWGFADQSLSSLTNFLLTFLVARSVDAADLGAFSLAFNTYLIFLNLARQLAMQPLLIRFSGTDESRWRTATVGATGLGLWVGVAGGLVCGGVGLLVPGVLGMDFLALALLMPGLMVQDCWRMAFFAAERGRAAFANDLVWTLVLLPAAVLVLRRDPSSAPLLIVVWGGSATVAAMVGVAQARARPRLRDGVRWFREHRRLSMPLTIEAVAGVVLQQLASLGAAIVAGLAVVGALRAAQLIIGPLLVLSQGLTLIAIPEGARLLRRSRAVLWRACLIYAGGTLAAYVLWGAAASRIPTDLGVALLHSNWLVAQPVVFPLALAIGTGAAGGALQTGLRVLAQARRVLLGGLISSALSAAGFVAGADAGGAVGAALLEALGNLVGAAVILRQLWTAMRQYEIAREAKGMPPRSVPPSGGI